MLTLATSLGLGSSRTTIRLIAPVACRRYASSKSSPRSSKPPPKTKSPTSKPRPQASLKATTSGSEGRTTSLNPSPSDPKPSSKPPPSLSTASSAGPSRTPPTSWSKSTPPTTPLSSAHPPPLASARPPTPLTSSTSPRPASRSTPLPQPSFSEPMSPRPAYRDPSKPRVAKRYDWPWDEVDHEDPDLIVEERVVYARPTAGSGWSSYKQAGGFVISFSCTTVYAYIVATTDIPAPPERESPTTMLAKAYRFVESASHNVATSQWTFPILSLLSLFCLRSITLSQLKPVKRIIQTRSRLKTPLVENGRIVPGQETVTTYLVTRNMDGIPSWFRRWFNVKEYREIDPSDISIRQHWGGLTYLMDIHGKSRDPWSFNNGLMLQMDAPPQVLIDVAKASGHPLVFSESRLKGVFGEIGPVRDGWIRKTWKRMGRKKKE